MDFSLFIRTIPAVLTTIAVIVLFYIGFVSVKSTIFASVLIIVNLFIFFFPF
ncbi:hypothetical protein GCM10028778_24380 [Barrientosiimonas marina]